jgi:hypothetical protein
MAMTGVGAGARAGVVSSPNVTGSHHRAALGFATSSCFGFDFCDCNFLIYTVQSTRRVRCRFHKKGLYFAVLPLSSAIKYSRIFWKEKKYFSDTWAYLVLIILTPKNV